jgi:hypothetical protein
MPTEPRSASNPEFYADNCWVPGLREVAHRGMTEVRSLKFGSAMDAGSRTLGLPRRMQFASEPTDSIGIHRIRRYGDLFHVIAFGAVERTKVKSTGPRQDARKPHARSAFGAAELLNCKKGDYGWVIGHCIPPIIRRERKTLSHR